LVNGYARVFVLLSVVIVSTHRHVFRFSLSYVATTRHSAIYLYMSADPASMQWRRLHMAREVRAPTFTTAGHGKGHCE